MAQKCCRHSGSVLRPSNPNSSGVIGTPGNAACNTTKGCLTKICGCGCRPCCWALSAGKESSADRMGIGAADFASLSMNGNTSEFQVGPAGYEKKPGTGEWRLGTNSVP